MANYLGFYGDCGRNILLFLCDFIDFSRNIAKRLYSQYSRYIDNMAGIVFLFFGCVLVYNGINEIIH